ncbi:FAD-dependent oxidoreductase [Synechococcus sp. MU1643]|uniref:NAD(P)/FAD-dependent oxidoreductase n=1 Tax=Synechococcus sp. MU1643 TaxID=2508349 RepID=UPI001D3185DE|nr:FAD-dependent oxidoreductase [Synechococcus sp. MU1643]
MNQMNNFDVIIIGGGPAGCSCALYTARSNISTIILDKNQAVGALAITHKIANYPGVEGDTSGEQLLKTMRTQAINYGAEYKQAQVYGISMTDSEKTVYTPEGTFVGKTLVLATGAMGRASTLPGENEFLGRGVSYCATCDGAFYKNQDVAVYGSNQEAIDEALVLTKFASTVHWITNSKPSVSSPEAQILLESDKVKHWKRTRVTSIQGDDQGVNSVIVQSTGKGEEQIVKVQGAFVYSTGSLPITDYLQEQIPVNQNGGIRVNNDMMTDLGGVWAIGDIRNTPFKQAVVACADGCIAAMAIDKYLNQRKDIRVDWVHR